ncbi:hypothetical protein B0T16DRAFT_492360 [Cercophora newfieldiana]|uniref:NAD(P)-binding domain-containing protein n=1 Tax=Cercophora newfieldiana TaxID=92897 RepID=A0AA39YDC4_9PEZI|nr:hypothetical protein B0T16DRAFT_492360 [Cercophora newfieldiana]
MASQPPKVLIFGATGKVASSAALAAHTHGASVTLALRNPLKPTPFAPLNTSPSVFPRVQADLSIPSSLSAAVTTSGATRAFVYVVYTTDDNMLSSFTALRDAGVTFVVLLSSYAVPRGDLTSLDEEGDYIAWKHAQIELALGNVFGVEGCGYVAIRGGYFATNATLWREELKRGGEVKLWAGGAEFDWVPPEDVGEVAGVIVAGEEEVLRKGEVVVDVVGGELLSQREVLEVVGRELFGRDVQVGEMKREEAVRFFREGLSIPEKSARTLVEQQTEREKGGDRLYGEVYFGESVGMAERFLGRPVMRFGEWVKKNKDMFL